MSYKIETEIVHGVEQSDPSTGALSMPIYQTSTFVFASADQGARRFKKEETGYIYSRLGNPNTDVLGKKIAVLEGFEAGLTMGSGMAAVSNVIFSTAKSGDHIIVDDTVYGGTHYLVEDEKVKIIDDGNLAFFVSMVEIDETRCPSDAFCIQPGRVLIKVVIEDARNSQFSTLLCLGDCSPSITHLRSFVFYNIEYTLVLKEVNPYPETRNLDDEKTVDLKLFRN